MPSAKILAVDDDVGLLQLMYEMLKSLYKAQVGTMGDLGPKIAQVEREVILEKARQTREETDDAI